MKMLHKILINNKKILHIADMTTTVFSKTLGSYGDGGAIFTNNKISKKN